MATEKLPSDNPEIQPVTTLNQHNKRPFHITAIVNLFKTRFISVNNPGFQHTEEKYQARTPASKAFYLIAYLLPGIMAYLFINIQPVHHFFSSISGLEGYHFQYYMFVIFTLFWHMLFPVFMLRKYEKLSWKEVIAFLSLDRFSFKEILFIAPLAFGFSVIVSLPYMLTLYTPFQQWLSSIPLFQIPSYSIFASYEAFYGAPVIILILMMIGNFVGEEIYFRGYLMKKTAFLGRYNWIVNSTLFCVYHLWQIPQTLPLIVPIMFFGLTMQLRKNLYTLIIFHLLFNLAGVQIYQVILGLGTGAH